MVFFLFKKKKKKAWFLQVWDRIKTCPTSLSNARALKLPYHKLWGLKRKRNRAQSSEILFPGTHSKSQDNLKIDWAEGQEHSPGSLVVGEATRNCLILQGPTEVSNLDLGLAETSLFTLRYQYNSHWALQATWSQWKGFWKDEKNLKLMNSLFSNCSLIGSLTVCGNRDDTKLDINSKGLFRAQRKNQFSLMLWTLAVRSQSTEVFQTCEEAAIGNHPRPNQIYHQKPIGAQERERCFFKFKINI